MITTDATSGYGPPFFWGLPATKTRGFTAVNYSAPTNLFQWHYHPEWEIVFSRAACGTRHVGESVEKFGPSDLVMLPGNVPHTWFSSNDQVGGSRWTVIHFLPKVWGEAFWKLPEVREFNDLCQRAQRGIRFTGEGVKEVGERMEALGANDAPSIAALMELLRIFALLPKLEVHSLNAVKEGSSGWQDARLDRLLEWLESRLAEPITQQEAAATIQMSPAAFSRWFKLNMGCVFSRYLNEIRVARVCSEIAHGKLSITEAAYLSGFNNLSNFNRRFLEVTGLTPKAFRVQIQQPAARKVTTGVA
ncbi:MAG: AraC family transcriptional regulator [Luteolibacter sp.]